MGIKKNKKKRRIRIKDVLGNVRQIYGNDADGKKQNIVGILMYCQISRM